ncbi:MAG: glycosyltransferase family 2 protein [Bacteroidota bacterium]
MVKRFCLAKYLLKVKEINLSSTKKIFFSVIIPTYNREKLIAISINSVLSQTYNHFELIIVDDGSTDKTEEVIKTFNDNRITYIKTVNSERAVARNTGIKHAKGEYITFLDSDDIYYPNYLQNAFESLTKFNLPPFFHLAYEVLNTNGKSIMQMNYIKTDDIKCLIKPNSLSCMGIFISKEVTNSYKFNEDRNLSGSEDWELWMRIIAKYGIKTDSRISSACIDHEERSMREVNPKKLIERVNLSINYCFNDKIVQNVYNPYKNLITANFYCYIALHMVLGNHKKLAIKYLLKSIILKPFIIFDKRSLATIKRLI